MAILQRYHSRYNGSTLVPQNYIDPETGFRLGRWVANLRQRVDLLDDDQVESLEKLGFVWQHRSKTTPWTKKLDALRKYKAEHGDTLVPKDYVDKETGFRLGLMVDRLRQSRSTLDVTRCKQLKDMGFVWNKHEAQWDDMFQLLCEYKMVYQHTAPSSREMFQGKPLGQWVSAQKQLCSRFHRSVAQNETSATALQRISKLESIGFMCAAKRTDDEDSASKEEDNLPFREITTASSSVSSSSPGFRSTTDFTELIKYGTSQKLEDQGLLNKHKGEERQNPSDESCSSGYKCTIDNAMIDLAMEVLDTYRKRQSRFS